MQPSSSNHGRSAGPSKQGPSNLLSFPSATPRPSSSSATSRRPDLTITVPSPERRPSLKRALSGSFKDPHSPHAQTNPSSNPLASSGRPASPATPAELRDLIKTAAGILKANNLLSLQPPSQAQNQTPPAASTSTSPIAVSLSKASPEMIKWIDAIQYDSPRNQTRRRSFTLTLPTHSGSSPR